MGAFRARLAPVRGSRILALVDSRFVTRVGNVGTLLKLVGVGVAVVIGVAATVAQLLPVRWWIPLLCFVVWLAVTLLVFASWRRNLARAGEPADTPVRSTRSNHPTSFAGDEFARLRDEGESVLAHVRSAIGEGRESAVKRAKQARPGELAKDKQKVYRWTREAGALVERKAPRFSLFFYGDDDQPIPREPNTTREQLATYLDARLTNLAQIIEAVSGEES
jgi:hypothetical protein